MSLKKNTIANYLCMAYTTLIGIIMMPFYLEYLGAETYGLVGFFVLMQTWLSLLSMGLTPMLGRQIAYVRGQGESERSEFRQLLRSIELIFFILAIVAMSGIWFASPLIAEKWLMLHTLSYYEVAYCISLMGVIIGLRWFASLYSSGINGMEEQVWLSGYSVVLATLRYVAVYGLLRWVSQKPEHFFEFQLMVAVIELLVLAIKLYRCLPESKQASNLGLYFSWHSIKAVLPFATGIAYTSSLWVLLTQTDKLILSHVLTLIDYGYFALVMVVANGIITIADPIRQAVLPRLTLLHSQGNEPQMLALYHKTTQYVAVVTFSVAGVIAIFSEQFLYSWTGNDEAAKWGAPVLTWFALGNGILVIAAFQYYLQCVHGQMRMHVINTTINAAFQMPILVYAAFEYGAIGVAISWFFIRLLAFAVWTPIVHKKFAPGLHWNWISHDVFPPLIAVSIVMAVAHAFIVQYGVSATRVEMFSLLVFVGIVSLVASMMATSTVRTDCLNLLWKLSYANNKI